MSVEGRPVHRLIACAACPCSVPAAVAETGLMPDEDLAGAKRVAVGAAGRWVGDPLPAVVCTSSPSTPFSLWL